MLLRFRFLAVVYYSYCIDLSYKYSLFILYLFAPTLFDYPCSIIPVGLLVGYYTCSRNSLQLF